MTSTAPPSLGEARTRARAARAHVLAGVALTVAGVLELPVAHAQAPVAVNVAVDATAPGTALEKIWPYYGYDEINNTTTPDGVSLLQKLAAANAVPPHIRFHFLFNSGDGVPSLKWGSTNVYTEDADGNPVYDFDLTNRILDALTTAGTLPFVELGFMPAALTAAPGLPYQSSSIYALNGGCFYPPRDDTKWAALISAWATHAQGRYPGAESTWLWELWNEPDSAYWHGTFADYAKLYDFTETALHQVLPSAQLGGPAVVSPDAFLTQFLQHCASGPNAATGGTGARLDLITFHAKGGTAVVGGHVEMNMGNQLRLHQSGFAAVAAVPAFQETPIYISEADPDGCAACPVSTDPEDAYRTSPAYGAYEIEMMKRSLELEARAGVTLRGLLTWAFTFPGTPYFAGYRALTTNDIDLPVLGDFTLLGRLAGTRLPVSSNGARALDDILANSVRGPGDVDAMATRVGSRVQVLVWNYHDDLVAVPATPVHLNVRLPAGFGSRASVTETRVDEGHGDAYTVWVAQGSPATPSDAQLAALRQTMVPADLTAGQVVDASGGSVALDLALPRFGVSLVTIDPLPAVADAAVDGPDAGVRDASVMMGPQHPSGCACRVGDRGRSGKATTTLGGGLLACLLLCRRRRRAERTIS